MTTISTRKLSAFFALALSAAAPLAGCAVGDDTDLDDASSSSSEVAIRPTFDLYKDAGGAWRFNLLASNGEGLIASQGYSSRTAALNGLLSVLDNGGHAALYEVKTASNGHFYFNLLAANRSVIGTSETYTTKFNAQRGVDATINAVSAYLEHWDTATGARFAVYEGASQKFFFSLYAKNGEKVLRSEAYDTEEAALNGAFSVADNGIIKARYAVLRASNGKYYFNLKASNGQVIGTSELYATKASAERGRNAVIAVLPEIELLWGLAGGPRLPSALRPAGAPDGALGVGGGLG